MKQIFPSADLTTEEIQILQDQHLNNRVVTQVLEESYRVNQERLREVQKLEEEVRKLEEELIRWEAEEKQRVADMLIDNCLKNLKKKTTKEVEPAEEEVTQYAEWECPIPPGEFHFVSLEESGRHLEFDTSSFFGIFPDSTCIYYLEDLAPGFPHFVYDSIEAVLLLWKFNSANDAKDEFTIFFSKAKSEIEKDATQILDDSENRLVMELIDRMEESRYEGSIGKTYSYERTLYTMAGFILYKNYILLIRIAADIPTSFEAKSITISKDTFSELEENTKLLLSGGE